VAQKKSDAVLGKWTKDIVNHFWFACKEASTYEQFVVCIIISKPRSISEAVL
jgi:hypothetical protein